MPLLLLRHLSSSVWSMRTQKPSEAMVGFSPSIAWCWTIQGFRVQKSLFMSWGVWNSSVPALLWSSCSLMLLYPSQKHCLKSKLHPYFPRPLLVLPLFFFLDIGFNENMEKKNVEKSRHWFMFWWKLRKPQARTSTPCCPLCADHSWFLETPRQSPLPSGAACSRKLAVRLMDTSSFLASSPTFCWSLQFPTWLDSQDPGNVSPVTASVYFPGSRLMRGTEIWSAG